MKGPNPHSKSVSFARLMVWEGQRTGPSFTQEALKVVKPRTLILKSYSSVGERPFLISKCGRNRPHLTREIASSVEPVDTYSNYISFPSASLNPGNVYQGKKSYKERWDFTLMEFYERKQKQTMISNTTECLMST